MSFPLRTRSSAEPLPFPPGPRYSLHFSFLGARHLPVADIPSFSSDPYIIATLHFPDTSLPNLHHRTPTIRATLSPDWNDSWVVANVPVTGIKLKVKVMDEDPGPGNGDDRLGVAWIETGRLDQGIWAGGGQWELGEEIRQSELLSMGKNAGWAGLLRVVTVGCGKGRWKGLGGEVDVGITVHPHERGEGDDEEKEEPERPYTIAPHWWSQHFSALIGIITHTTADGPGDAVKRYSFAATKIQLAGPLPPVLRHRYVAFRPIIKTFYTKSGLLGIVLNRVLKNQYRTIYSYNKATQYGEEPPANLARAFLQFAHWGEGGRLFTYVITLDGEWRFTETGKEFGIQMLSKHTMHSCVSLEVGFAGEFFVTHDTAHALAPPSPSSPPVTPTHSSPFRLHRRKKSREDRKRNLPEYTLHIDNDSGTYRPPKDHLPALQKFLERNLPGLNVKTADAFDKEHMQRKEAHVAGKRAGRFKQVGDEESISSSDEEKLRDDRPNVLRRAKQRVWREVSDGDRIEEGPGTGR